MAEYRGYIGLDVHKDTIAAAVAWPVRAGDGAPRDGAGGGAVAGVQGAGPARPVRGP